MIIRHRTISILSLIILNFIIFSAYADDLDLKDEAKQHYQKGKQYYEQGQYKKATEEFQKALELISQKEKALPEKTEEVKPIIKEKEKVGLTKVAEAVSVKEPQVIEYYIEVEDVLDISVWKIDDLSRPEVIVRPDGKISFPLIGDVQAAGLTLTQLDEVISEKLKTYIKDPQVSIMIRSFGGRKVIVLGEVKSPGVYKYTRDIQLMEAIGLAGDFTQYAVTKNILVIRGGRDKPQPILVNAYDIITKANLSANLFMEPQDIVYVPRSLIGNVNTFLGAIAPTIDTLYKGIVTYDIVRPKIE